MAKIIAEINTIGDASDAASLTRLFQAILTDLNALANNVTNLNTGTGLIATAGLAIGVSSKAKVLNGAFNYQFSGIRATKASAETAFTATTHDIADPDANGREAIYVLSIASGGTITITKGTDAVLGASVAPNTPANEIKLGEVKVAHNGTAIFDASTDLLDAAHLTVTYTNSAANTGFSPSTLSLEA